MEFILQAEIMEFILQAKIMEFISGGDYGVHFAGGACYSLRVF